MPKSSAAGKHWARKVINSVSPKLGVRKVIDVGAGMGTYVSFRSPGQHWTAVEVWAPYIDEFQLREKYDAVVQQDVRSLDWNSLGDFDLAIFGDVLEHMSKDDALNTLNSSLAHTNLVLVSIPIVYSPQEEEEGNPFEVHVKPDWSHGECLDSLPAISICKVDDPVGVYFLTRNPQTASLLKQVSGEIEAECVSDYSIAEDYRKTILANTSNIRLVIEYAFKCHPSCLDHVIETLEFLCGATPRQYPAVLYYLGLLVFFSERRERKSRGLSLSNAQSDADIRFQFSGALIAEWRSACLEFLAIKPSSYGAHQIYAQCALAAGDLVELQECTRRARLQPHYYDLLACANFAPEFHAHLVEVKVDDALPPLKWALQNHAGAGRILFTAGDTKYFQRYGLALADRFSKFGTGSVLVVHLFDASEAEAMDVAASLQTLLGASFSLSWELSPAEGARAVAARDYYHAVRFARFLQAISISPTSNAFLLDMDIGLNQPADRLFPLLNGDIAVWGLPARLEIHNQIAAGIIGISSSSRARTFLHRVSAYLIFHLGQRALPWGIDQTALFVVLTVLMSDTASKLDVTTLPENVFDGSQDATRLLASLHTEAASPQLA